MQNKNPTITNGVVITSYVESPRTRSIKPSDDPTKKTKPHPRFRISQTARSQGYDHRAQLLSYSRQLRENARSHKNVQVQFPQNQSNPKGQASSLFLLLHLLSFLQMPKICRELMDAIKFWNFVNFGRSGYCWLNRFQYTRL